MKDFFKMPRGEFIATTVLVALIIATFLFYFLYEKRSEPTVDLKNFKREVEQFYACQQAAADSMAASRAARDSAYRHSKYDKKSYYRQWTSSARQTYENVYSKDTATLKPLPKKEGYAIVKINLNQCDTSDITRVPTFGSKRARKIVEYRDKLGGFSNLSQLKEIYILQNVDLSLCQKYFTVNTKSIRKIRVSTATYKELISHPYIDAYLAKTILNYREKGGKIHNITEFQSLTHAYQELVEKLTPYLDFE